MDFSNVELSAIEAQLIAHESAEPRPYLDTVGKTTIGVGRNLDDKPLKVDEVLYLLRNDLYDATKDAMAAVGTPVFCALSKVRQNVLIDMAFNLGLTRLMGFKRFLYHLRRGEYQTAAYEMIDSRWYRQVGTRGIKLVEMMKKG